MVSLVEPLGALLLAGLVLAAGAYRLRAEHPHAPAWRAIVACTLAIPVAWLGTLILAERILRLVGVYTVGPGVVLLVLVAFAARRLPAERVFQAAAILPFLAIAFWAFKVPTTSGGALSAALGVVLIVSAMVLPRAYVLAGEDPSRRFVSLVTGIVLGLGGPFALVLAALAVAQGGLGIGG